MSLVSRWPYGSTGRSDPIMEMFHRVYDLRHYFAPLALSYGARVPTVEEREAIFNTAWRRVRGNAFRQTDKLNWAIRDVTVEWLKAKRGTCQPSETPRWHRNDSARSCADDGGFMSAAASIIVAGGE